MLAAVGEGFEPSALCLTGRHSTAELFHNLAGREGFEPTRASATVLQTAPATHIRLQPRSFSTLSSVVYGRLLVAGGSRIRDLWSHIPTLLPSELQPQWTRRASNSLPRPCKGRTLPNELQALQT